MHKTYSNLKGFVFCKFSSYIDVSYYDFYCPTGDGYGHGYGCIGGDGDGKGYSYGDDDGCGCGYGREHGDVYGSGEVLPRRLVVDEAN